MHTFHVGQIVEWDEDYFCQQRLDLTYYVNYYGARLTINAIQQSMHPVPHPQILLFGGIQDAFYGHWFRPITKTGFSLGEID